MVGAGRKRVSKNKKANWRKHSNIQDVEDYLEDVRLQERTGGLVAEKKDSELFFIDRNEEDKSTKRKTRGLRPLRCHAALLPDPKIKPARVAHNIKRLDKKKPRKFEEKKSKSTAKSTPSLPHKQHKQILETSYDLWGEGASIENVKEKDIEAIDDGHYLRVTKKKPVKAPPKLRAATSKIKAVEAPHPGASYNPTFVDHQNLLQEALDIEIEKEKAEMKMKRALDESFPDRSEAPNEEDYIVEMSAGLNSDQDSDEEEFEPEDLDNLSVNPPVNREDKKTQTQRNKERRIQEQAKLKKRKKLENVKKNEFYRIKSLKKELNKAEDVSFERQYRKAVQEKLKKEGTHKLGKLKFTAPEIEIKLSDEIEGSLRLLKPEGHLLEDRFKSFQKRNIIEPRNRAKKVIKYKKKTFEKKGHKAITLD